MKYWVFFFLCTISFALTAHEGYEFTVQKKEYFSQSVFEFESKGERPFGTVIIYRYINPLRTHYHYYDDNGIWQSTARSVLLCYGAGGWGRKWGTEIEIFDNEATYYSQGNRIGYIDGQVATTAPAKFSLYNRSNEVVGIAYLDETKSGFTIVDPSNDKKIIARLTRNFIQDVIDPWEVSVYDKTSIDPIMIKMFAAFAVDSQDYFKVDK